MPEHRNCSAAFRSNLPAQIASTVKVRDVRISPDGSMILYQVQPFYRVDRMLSELWLAHIGVPDCAQRLTSGDYHDRAGVFHPDGQKILFLSDRHSPGSSAAQIYVLFIEAAIYGGAQSVPVLSCPKGVQSFEVSPNGQYIAYTSVDLEEPPSAEVKNKSDARVFGGSRPRRERFARLRVFDASTGETITLDGIRKDRHIESYAWSPDSTRLLYRLRSGRGPEFAEQEIVVESIFVRSANESPQYLGTYPRSPSGQSIWVPGSIVSLQNYEPRNILDARALFAHHAEKPFSSIDGAKRLYGLTEDAVRMVDVGGNPSVNERMVAVEVCSDVDTHIDVVAFDESIPSAKTCVTVFRTQDEAIWFGAWDVKRVADSETGDTTYVVAAVLSSGVRHEPPNVWAVRVTSDGRELFPRIRLSSHLQWLSDLPSFKTEVLRWQSEDGVSLSGLIRYPPGYDASQGPRPTILFIHGGPYRRDIPDYMPYFCNWREFLTLAGYLVISPNYRGSQGRGHDFAYAASKGIGVYDWPDCESMVHEVIRRGIADPDRLGIAGWSHGGSLTAWGVTKTKTLFKAAIVGAGVTNWEGMVTDSGSPELEAEIGQSAPWNSECDGNGQESMSVRKTSPIHSVSGVTTAVLILHGEKDERVPVSQGIGFWRGLKRRASQRGKEAAQLVLYPREPHGFTERKHAEDVLEKVLSYLETWL